MPKKMSAKIEGGMLNISIPIEPKLSKTGKTLVIASTRGNKELDLEHDGQPIYLGLNAYVYKD